MVDSGILLIKYWIEVSEEEQTKRLQSRVDEPGKIWKLSPMDLKSYTRWYDYAQRPRPACSRRATLTWAPWNVVHNDDKRRGRLNLITHLLSQFKYSPLPTPEVVFPTRQKKPKDYVEPAVLGHPIPTPY